MTTPPTSCMSTNAIRYCSDFPDALCCDSCHADDEYSGRGLLEFGVPDVHTLVCCGVSRWARENGISLQERP